jgi:hypothetical protein
VTLFNLTFPDNALFLFKLISQISRFNLIPIDHIVNSWFRFTPHIEGEEVINENFGIMGYESWNLMQTLDTVILFIIGIVVSVVLTFLIDLLVPIPVR